MATCKIEGVGEYLQKLSELSGDKAQAIIKQGVYDGAKLVADEVRRQIEALPDEPERYDSATASRESIDRQKQGLLAGLDLITMERKNGAVYTKVTFVGYNDIKTKKWPNGQPNAVIARSIEKGTSFMRAHPFRKRAIAASKETAVAAIGKTIDDEINKIFTE